MTCLIIAHYFLGIAHYLFITCLLLIFRGEVPSRDANSYIDSKGLVKKLQYKCFMDILDLLKGCSKCVLRFSEKCLKGCSKSVKWKFQGCLNCICWVFQFISRVFRGEVPSRARMCQIYSDQLVVE